MIDDKTRNEILDSIDLSGSVESNIHVNGNISHVISRSSGSPRIQSNVAKRFLLVLGQPEALRRLNPFEIRCAVCHKVISYPAWYYVRKLAVNEFHYFVCFSETSPSKPNTHCIKERG
jgi:hypothetical protein